MSGRCWPLSQIIRILVMSHHALLDRLAVAELEFAQFNAFRTSSAPTASICMGSTKALLHLTDSSRPQSAYYNRAIAKEVGALSMEALQELTAGVIALEVRPNEVRLETANRLHALGFRPSDALCYLHAAPSRVPLEVKLHVTRLQAAQKDLFFDLLESAGTAFPSERRVDKAAFYCTDEFQAFVAKNAQGNILGWSTMFIRDEFAYLGNSFTRPEHRRQGAQSALLAARLNAAAGAGVEHVFTDVEHGSQSQRNCERLGLRTVTINTIWVRDLPLALADG